MGRAVDRRPAASRSGRGPARAARAARARRVRVSRSRSVIGAASDERPIAAGGIAATGAPSPARLPVDALTLTAAASTPEQRRDRRAHRVETAAEPRPGADDRQVDRAGRQPAARERARRPPRSSSALAMPRACRVIGREQPAEVAQAGRAEQRVGDRVERDVAVGVAVQPRRAVDLDAAEARAARRARTGGCRRPDSRSRDRRRRPRSARRPAPSRRARSP